MQITKAYLGRINQIDKAIDNKLKALERLKTIAYGVTAGFGGDGAQSSGSKEKMADAVVQIADIEKECKMDVELLIKEWLDIVQTIELLRDDHFSEYDILMKHYALGIKLIDYANENGKSESWAHGLHKKAIEKLNEVVRCTK